LRAFRTDSTGFTLGTGVTNRSLRTWVALKTSRSNGTFSAVIATGDFEVQNDVLRGAGIGDFSLGACVAGGRLTDFHRHGSAAASGWVLPFHVIVLLRLLREDLAGGAAGRNPTVRRNIVDPEGVFIGGK
jgi:hypothetical protein